MAIYAAASGRCYRLIHGSAIKGTRIPLRLDEGSLPLPKPIVYLWGYGNQIDLCERISRLPPECVCTAVPERQSTKGTIRYFVLGGSSPE